MVKDLSRQRKKQIDNAKIDNAKIGPCSNTQARYGGWQMQMHGGGMACHWLNFRASKVPVDLKGRSQTNVELMGRELLVRTTSDYKDKDFHQRNHLTHPRICESQRGLEPQDTNMMNITILKLRRHSTLIYQQS
ncbi:hypothetical protein TWF694_009727 [Orbilia ellipsospora]|uniref:Uncharacterized protein n=1 Tax=Orbilia ellipsospora TaxID=2528407 RepID=A0AAV9XI41_9PEZI